jgi:ATP-dependent helicase/nuclease subunit B
MRPRRTFIDWHQPALAGVVEHLCSRRAANGFVDLSGVIVVTPGGRAGRRFLELLAERTDGRNAAPQLATPGDLPERLYELKRPLADDLTQRFAWVEALRGLADEQIRCIVGEPPADADIQGWLTIGQMLAKVHRELSADVKTFRDVAKLPAIHAAREFARWSALAEAQEAYLRKLDELGLWDRQTARLVAIERREPRTECDIVLIGLADMNGTLRAMLEQVAERVHVFVHAPEELAERFDEFGALAPDLWEESPIELNEDWLTFADRPMDQADAAAEFLAERGESGDDIDDVVIGLADEALASPVRVALEERGVGARWIGARTVGATSAFRLLEAVAERLDDDSTEVTCTLLRHPAVGRWIDNQPVPLDWLQRIDRAVIDHAPRRLGGGYGRDPELATSRAIAECIDRWLSPLTGTNRALGDWAAPICEVLEIVYADARLDLSFERERFEYQSLEAIRAALVDQSRMPETLAPTTSAAAAIRLALDAVVAEQLTPDSAPDSVELIGWLELPLDDAPSLVVCGMNDGHVPSSLNSDMFLPNGLREQLGLEDNRRRLARDVYALSVISHSRAALRLISGRHNAAGDPQLPSRLLFSCDVKTMARRVQRAFRPPQSDSRVASDSATAVNGLRIPRPVVRTPPAIVSVTAFRDYIACPYRFYLKYVEDLRLVEELDGELTGATFGTLIHEALSEWARGPAVDATSASELKSVLKDAFDAAASRWFDAEPLPAVKLQLEQGRLRLDRFADWQSGRRQQGWRIRQTEVSASCVLPLKSGRSLQVRGRIDRIDHNPETGQWAIIDYKTGDAGDGPREVHFAGGKWIDLQLPLYRRLAASLDIHGPVVLAYITLSRDSMKEVFQPADWKDGELAAADDEILRIAEHVAAGDFWPPAKTPPTYDDYARIAQEGVFGREEFA